MTQTPDQGAILDRIRALIDEEHAIREQAARHPLESGEETEQLDRVQEALDQCWDLLRQRRARSEAGQDPDTAHVRSVREVARYLQ